MLQARCRDRAREGLWLLTQWVVTHQGWSRDNALETIAPDHAALWVRNRDRAAR